MITLVILTGSFLVFTAIARIANHRWEFAGPARSAMAVLLAFTGVSHFFLAEGMARMLPEIVPFRIPIVYLTGVAELVLALVLLLPPRVVPIKDFRRRVGIVAMLFLAALTPANVYAAIQAVEFGGHTAGPIYLIFRIPLQILFLIWIYLAFVRPGDSPQEHEDSKILA